MCPSFLRLIIFLFSKQNKDQLFPLLSEILIHCCPLLQLVLPLKKKKSPKHPTENPHTVPVTNLVSGWDNTEWTDILGQIHLPNIHHCQWFPEDAQEKQRNRAGAERPFPGESPIFQQVPSCSAPLYVRFYPSYPWVCSTAFWSCLFTCLPLGSTICSRIVLMRVIVWSLLVLYTLPHN